MLFFLTSPGQIWSDVTSSSQHGPDTSEYVAGKQVKENTVAALVIVCLFVAGFWKFLICIGNTR